MMTHIHTPISTLHCSHRRIFFLHVYRSVSLALMRRYMQLAYLFHQYAKSLLSTDGRIADCTVRHSGVERPFSSIFDSYPMLHFMNLLINSSDANSSKNIGVQTKIANSLLCQMYLSDTQVAKQKRLKYHLASRTFLSMKYKSNFFHFKNANKLH